MDSFSSVTLIKVIRRPEIVRQFSGADWGRLVGQARRANLLGYLHTRFSRENLLGVVPAAPLAHLIAGEAVAARQADVIKWEVSQIARAAREEGVPVVLLKGAAYVMAGLHVAEGRVFNDLDILVPEAALTSMERALYRHGWANTHHDEYDQRYYREWMHELPPLMHVRRKTILDIHHNILPRTARTVPDASLLLQTARPVDGIEDVYILAPVDMVIHSAVHLFSESEYDNGLRDLCDLHTLMTEFSVEPGFWDDLVARADQLGLLKFVAYGMHFSSRLLNTAVPEGIMARLRGALHGIGFQVLARALEAAFVPQHPSCRRPLVPVALFFLYVRGHYQRMPLHLLVPHLARKAVKGNHDG